MAFMRVMFLCAFFLVAVTSASAQEQGSIALTVPQLDGSFSLLVPQNTVTISSNINIYDNNIRIPAEVSYTLLWPNSANQKYQYVRILNIKLLTKPSTKLLTLRWQTGTKLLSETSKSEKLNSRIIYPNSSWLRKALLLTDDLNVDDTWYRSIQSLTATYLADEEALTKNNYPRNKASQWLYDRPQAFYQLYLATNNHQWKRYADRFVTFYKSQIDDEGFFKLAKPEDVKYLMGRSLVYHHLLNYSESSLDVLGRLYNASLSWDAGYSTGRGFWTERHHAAALNVAISYWELTNKQSAKDRIEELINTLLAMTFTPENQWPVSNCPQHTFNAHEGWGDESPTCSPWMMALLADNLWRYYWLTNSDKSRQLLVAFADFIAEKGIFIAPKGKIKGQIIPKYLVSLQNSKQEELDAWSDRQHTCDVASMMGKGLYVEKIEGGRLKTNTLSVFKKISNLCQAQHVAINEKYKYVKLERLTSKPPRKFNWQYSTTDDLPWLMSVLNQIEQD
ncbi:hypothetical protein [Thalassotalea insulae]|nr:hypothetical protein [Thalassotalea insulae]